MALQKKRKPERIESFYPKNTFSYMNIEQSQKPSLDNNENPITLPETDYRRINGTKSSSARLWIDTLNRLNALVTMQYAESINELIIIMLDNFEDRLDDHDKTYQELLLKMYNTKRK
ncbi:hypothetical protein [Pisciglobus halotolerans]|uniref:Uncharacterized protein n=1 Tax=Pisciglobus halotolerans TaxID=745365 RepID=A0A1I3E268_9LACT|nr:hypothetical protein [Pisciglobus halotolerans]SFH92928.1 hypothetical protein SAMN04489868_1642 [Pisciglobus halotolerans]